MDEIYWMRGRTVSAIEPSNQVQLQHGRLSQESTVLGKGTLQCSSSSSIFKMSNGELDKMDQGEKLARYKMLIERVSCCRMCKQNNQTL